MGEEIHKNSAECKKEQMKMQEDEEVQKLQKKKENIGETTKKYSKCKKGYIRVLYNIGERK